MKKSIAAVVALLLASVVSVAYAYQIWEEKNDGKFMGKCNNGSIFTGQAVGDAGFYAVTGPMGYFSERGRDTTIRKACGE